jgi:hypothetical protein
LAVNVQPAPNGIHFFSGYKNWKPVSTTDRFDNATFRVILGNDVAQKAIAENKIHPWPDGSTFAKIAWLQHTDPDGEVISGEFIQVEFMLKDAAKYKSTEGWGFARWRGTDFKPYGTNANFTTECTSCHRPMEENDYVFTMPIHDPGTTDARFNAEAALPADLPYQPLQWRVITSFSQNPPGTMSTLYGNDLAVDHARTSPNTGYPNGAVLALVTWDRQNDRHWFGAMIPGSVRKVEFASFATSVSLAWTFEVYEGSPLHRVDDTKLTYIAASHLPAITSLKAAVMP